MRKCLFLTCQSLMKTWYRAKERSELEHQQIYATLEKVETKSRTENKWENSKTGGWIMGHDYKGLERVRGKEMRTVLETVRTMWTY